MPPRVLRDVSVFALVEHQAKVGDICRYSVERENVIVFELLDQSCFPAEFLRHLLTQRRKEYLVRESRDMLTLSTARAWELSSCTLRILSTTLFSLYLPFQISVVLERWWAYGPSFTTPSSRYDVGNMRQ